MKLRNEIILASTLLLIALASTACKKEQGAIELDPNGSVNTEVQEIPKSVDTMMETLKDLTPVENKDPMDTLITKTLLNHYKDQFGDFGNPIKAVGYKMYLIEDGAPGEKKAYGYACYNEYEIDGDKVKLKCGSGSTPVALSFMTDGSGGQVFYEVLTDGDIGSEEFNKAFPESVREKLTNRDMKDMDEIKQMEQANVRKQYKEITGKELKTEISDIVE